jgi:hypothetical protein
MKKLKVFGGCTFVDGRQVRTIIATTSKKKVSEVTGIQYTRVLDYWSQTFNKVELEIALAKPETVFVASSFMGEDFRELI